MNITEVRVKMVSDGAERLRAFCSITLDGEFVVRDLKIIDGANGPFVAMPSRKLSDRCDKCGWKNHLRARFCNECGANLNENRAPRDEDGRVKLHADIAHPINAECRERIQQAVIDAFENELELQKDPAYAPAPYEDESESFRPESEVSEFDELIAELRSNRRQREAPSEAIAHERPRAAPRDARESQPRHSQPQRGHWQDNRGPRAEPHIGGPNGRHQGPPVDRRTRGEERAPQREQPVRTPPPVRRAAPAFIEFPQRARRRVPEAPPANPVPQTPAPEDLDNFAAGIL